VFFTPKEVQEVHDYISHGGDMLVSMNMKTKKLFAYVDEPWNEQELEELKEISYLKESLPKNRVQKSIILGQPK